MKFSNLQAALVVVFGTQLASTGALWIRLVPDLSPIVVGWYRVFGAGLFFLPFFIRQRRRQPFVARSFRYSLLAGIALALHFALWISSLYFTSVSNSVLLVATHPIFVAILARFVFRLPLARQVIWGIALAFVGTTIIQWHALGDEAGFWGNMMALGGGLFAALYFLFSHRSREILNTIDHVVVTYLAAAVILFSWAVIGGYRLVPVSWEEVIFLALLILLPTVGGHTIFNWGVKQLGPTRVSLLMLLEPPESAFLAFLFLGELVAPTTWFGGSIILFGLFLALKRRKRV
ncbi:MAG: EamA family transporter [Candidatus Marinimicrobia bacterium]|nr:EamA family transporter [Candidatus Neomarinimicrobiota bacterium]